MRQKTDRTAGKRGEGNSGNKKRDDSKGMSFPMRSKEDAQDYRYFPEPDLLTISVDEKMVQELKESLPELPNAKIKRYVNDFGLAQIDATLIAEDMEKSSLFDKCNLLNICKPKNISNWILSDISKYINETGKLISETNLTSENLCALVEKIEKGVISNSAGKTVFDEIMKNGGDVDSIIEQRDWHRIPILILLKILLRKFLQTMKNL